MDITDLASQAVQHLKKADKAGNKLVCPLPGLMLLQHYNPTLLEGTLYEPVICLILQGRKETILGNSAISFGPGESLIVSHSVPVVSRITEASADSPYLAMILTIDLGLLRSFYNEIGHVELEGEWAKSLNVGKTDVKLQDALGRYLSLSGHPIEEKVMAPLVLKEIHFRLLLAPHGGMLRKLLVHESYASDISRAIVRIREHFREPLSVPGLASSMNMSNSSFHKHFKEVTSTTPLQYQKELRLLEAKRLLQEGRAVTAAAFEVGYESPTQFSREYARKFGASPRKDIDRLDLPYMSGAVS